MKPYQIGRIEISLPKSFVTAGSRISSIPCPIPDGPPTTEYFMSFKNGQRIDLTVFFWDGYPYRDYGPMSEIKSFPFNLAGQDTRIVQTDIFMGKNQEVLVVHGSIPENDYLMIFSSTLDLEHFKALLQTIRIR